MSSPETAGRMALWAVELSKFDIQYRPQTAIKGQVVADFIAEFTLGDGQEERRRDSEIFIRTDLPIDKQEGPVW